MANLLMLPVSVVTILAAVATKIIDRGLALVCGLHLGWAILVMSLPFDWPHLAWMVFYATAAAIFAVRWFLFARKRYAVRP